MKLTLNVVDIKTKEQYEADSVSLQDRVTDVAESTGEFASEQFSRVKAGIGSGVAVAQEKLGEGAEFVQEKLAKALKLLKTLQPKQNHVFTNY